MTSSTPQRRASSNFGATDFQSDPEAQGDLVAFLRMLLDSDTAPKGSEVKDQCPSLQTYESSTLNSKIKQFWKKLKRDDYELSPMELSKPSKRQRLLAENGFDPSEVDGNGDVSTTDLEHLLGLRPTPVPATQLPSNSRPIPKNVLASSSGSNVRATGSALPSQPATNSNAIKLAYTRLGNQNSTFTSNFRMHEIFDGMNAKGLRFCYILIRLPAPCDFIDPKFPLFENPETTAIVKYLSNDSNNEIFRYSFNLPEAVDSTCIKERFIYRTITTPDVKGNSVTINQKVAVLYTYLISGQSFSGAQELW
ncbi:hypothetical protein BCR33DRAFT_784497 [Rhizoclosmatium globosum]|uniref:Uncharacterized protein n=1 Tax=Rhizoclosmatium globosum TaxID=329046 RepID=A0A1Y2CE06_9FUNG|nr:hypothetical protein BCR33DRAFT_784497 [Rhizoclosmatium globosum]|eukprot:ORY45044.1 hypothetical protein BCR33DRAFT_784497 [Rhizoclosmatium globosum]